MKVIPSHRARVERLSLRRATIVVAAVCVSLASSALALATAPLSQAPGTGACVADEGDGGCATAHNLFLARSVAVSPDGRNVYVVSALPGTAPTVPGAGELAIFDRDPDTGALDQKSGRGGCVAEAPAGNCEPGRALQEPRAVTVSPDGRSVYVASEGAGAVAIFQRDTQTGVLHQSAEPRGCVSLGGANGCEPGRGLSGADGVVASSDGRDLYVSGFEGSVAAFHRNMAGGAERLEQLAGKDACISNGGVNNCAVGRQMAGLRDVEISPDGETLYTTSLALDAVAVLHRDPATGRLEQLQGSAGCISNAGGTCTRGRLLDGARGLAVSPDGEEVYVLSTESPQANNALTVFDRDSKTGELQQRGGTVGCLTDTGNGGECAKADGFRGVAAIAVSRDGESVYVTALESRSVAILDRDAMTGSLTQGPGAAGCLSEDPGEGCEPGRALRAAEGIAVSPDGGNVYVAGTSAKPAGTVAILSRAGSTGGSDAKPPRVAGFKLSPARFRPLPRGHGSHFSFSLSERARVTISIERARPGRKVGKTCRAPTPKLARHPRCTRFVRRARLNLPAQAAGAVSLAFSGRAGRRALAPGAYRATLVARDAAGNASTPARARFTVHPPVRRKPPR